jgi:radical SAM superfamily enzyme YgiQ (UPF0313 family)
VSDPVRILWYRKAVTYGFHPGAIRVAGGVHATGEPVQTLDAGWDVAAIGEGETTLLKLVDAAGDHTDVPGLAYRDSNSDVVKTGRAERLPLDTFRAFSLRWNRFSALEISRGCIFACRFCQTPFMFSAKFRYAVAGRPTRRRRSRDHRRGRPALPAGRPLRPLAEAARPRGPLGGKRRAVP